VRSLDVFPANALLLLYVLVSLSVWSAFWGDCALWASTRNGSKGGFVFFLIVHLAGIPELVYLHMKKCWPFKS